MSGVGKNDERFEFYFDCFVFFYDLDEDITSGLIETGKKRIDTTDRVIEYMMWALKVWRNRYDK